MVTDMMPLFERPLRAVSTITPETEPSWILVPAAGSVASLVALKVAVTFFCVS